VGDALVVRVPPRDAGVELDRLGVADGEADAGTEADGELDEEVDAGAAVGREPEVVVVPTLAIPAAAPVMSAVATTAVAMGARYRRVPGLL